jgi:hypothetical protein
LECFVLLDCGSVDCSAIVAHDGILSLSLGSV